ncbi:MAG: hypothetical protein R3213_03400, partial [Flavobacteriaceae bacterium]|nr:hypothetical protein [Flavobacteriaceae bacterium]
MKNLLLLLFLAGLLINCNEGKSHTLEEPTKNLEEPIQISSVEIEDLIVDSSFNVRALEWDMEQRGGMFASSDGRIGIILNYGKQADSEDQESKSWYIDYIETNFPENTNFRSLALTRKSAFALTIESPARLYKMILEDPISFKLVYEETHEKAFYDSIEFWNEEEGIAIGDPTGNCMSIIITRDAGETWQKIDCSKLPESKEGEAAFAASDTNIAIVGDSTWVATGGMSSRILFSPNKGETWEFFDTPMVQGKETTGIYSIDFYEGINGFAIGGDYTQPEANVSNKIRTKDGGKTWQVVASGKNPGYRSCVQYVPNSKANELVAIGFNGIDYTHDNGETWTHLSDEGFYTLRFVNDSIAIAAGNGR